ncbi:hypothetical protein SAMN02927924_01452 [Sphingobium faniae]|nr:hypothetical protein SAMN02927924_01452 [Sphingobium faniae]
MNDRMKDSTSEVMLRLAERVEKLEGPDRKVDLEIARYRGVTVWKRNYDDTGNYETTHWHYTASIDAAMTLVPKGAMRRSGDSAVGLMGTFFCDIVTEVGRDFHALANNEPCAIVAAALRASIGKGE